MPFDRVERPLAMPDAFTGEVSAATLSAADALLLLGFHIRGDEAALAARAEAGGEPGIGEPAIPLPAEDVAPLEVPLLRATGERIQPAEAQASLVDVIGRSPRDREIARDEVGQVAERFAGEPTHLRAGALFEASLAHFEEMVRVAAAADAGASRSRGTTASGAADVCHDPRRHRRQ